MSKVWKFVVCLFGVILLAIAFIVIRGCDTERVVRDATPKVVDQATDKVVAKATIEASERVYKDTVPMVVIEATKQAVPKVVEEATKEATPKVVEAAVPPVVAESVKQVVPLAVPLVVKEAIPPTVAAAVPLVEAKAKVECCDEKSAPAKVTGQFTGGGGTSSSPSYRVSAHVGQTSPATVAASPAVDDTRIPNPDLPPRLVDGERLLTPRCGGGMGPQLLPPGALVTFDGERVRISGVKPVKVEIYTPRRRTLESACEFSAVKGERFNFTFRCAKGHEHYALLTDNMAAFLPDFFGQGIGLDNTDCCGSAFITQ